MKIGSEGCWRPVVALATCCSLNATVGGCSPNNPGVEVSSAEFERTGKVWPLLVRSGHVGCSGNQTWFKSGGTKYGLNGFADKTHGFADVEAIWAPGENTPRVNIGDLLNAANALCVKG